MSSFSESISFFEDILGDSPIIFLKYHICLFITNYLPILGLFYLIFTGKFRHLPVVENGEVIAMLDITKCLYDAISRMEKAAEQGSAIAAAVEGVERQWGSNLSGCITYWICNVLFLYRLDPL